MWCQYKTKQANKTKKTSRMLKIWGIQLNSIKTRFFYSLMFSPCYCVEKNTVKRSLYITGLHSVQCKHKGLWLSLLHLHILWISYFNAFTTSPGPPWLQSDMSCSYLFSLHYLNWLIFIAELLQSQFSLFSLTRTHILRNDNLC